MSSMLVPPESTSAVLVMIRSKSVSICNRFRASLVDSSRNRTFSRGYPNLVRSYGGLLEPTGSKLAPLKSAFNAEPFICRLSWSISSDFDAVHSWSVCVAASNREKITKNFYFGVQGRSRSSMFVPPESSSAVLVMMRSKSVSICNRSLAIDWTTVAETARFEGGTQIWCIRTEESLNLGGQTLHRWNLRLMPNISYAGCPGLSWMLSAQFILNVCTAA